MGRYIIRRIIISLLTLFFLITIMFVLVRMLPGDPFTSSKMTPELRVNMERYYGFDKPIIIQYFQYIKNLFKGDFGYSFNYTNWTVTDIIKQGFPYSLNIGIRAVAFSSFFGIVLGITASLNRGRIIDKVCILIAIVGASVPNFVVASLLQYVFGVKYKILPVAGLDTFRHTILPTFALGFYGLAYQTRLMRSSMLEVVNKDYIKTAKAKGLKRSEIIVKHQIRNAILPIVTVIGPTIAAAITGTFVIESIFAIPGIGKYYVLGVQTLDYTLILGLSIFYGFFLVSANFIVDLVYGYVDPRIKLYDK